MDRTKIKNYAPQARRDFRKAVTGRLALFGIKYENEKLVVEELVRDGTSVVVGGRAYPRSLAAKRDLLEQAVKRDGFDQTVERLSYTWFNRLVAIRYMEIHGYLDHGYRVLSNPSGEGLPEILEHAEHVDLPGLTKDLVIDLKLNGNRDGELYRKLLVAQCNALHSAMPFLFERVDDETELALPENLLHSDSIVSQLVANLGAKECQSVEVLGWLYQFYISERKDEVMGRPGAVPSGDIPAVTQLFTPHWIVRYLVENSLGRFWLQCRPTSRLRERMPYYVERESEVSLSAVTKPEEICIVDPAVGSGHMLTYAFDLLATIYEEEGYRPTEIPTLILKHNLYGLELCPRAAQLARLSLTFKARERSHRFLEQENLVCPQVVELYDIRFTDDELSQYVRALGVEELFSRPVLSLLRQFEYAGTLGSLIKPCLGRQAIAKIRAAVEGKDLGGQLFLNETHMKVLAVLGQADALCQKYHVVVANPPYMGSSGMATGLRRYVNAEYVVAKADLFATFMQRANSLCMSAGYSALVTMQTWMFLSSFEQLRASLLATNSIVTLLQIGYNSFPEMNSKVAQACAFVLQHVSGDTKGTYFNLNDAPQSADKEAVFSEKLRQRASFAASGAMFHKIPGHPIAYWVSEGVQRAFLAKATLGSILDAREGMSTGNNAAHVRCWWEPSCLAVGFGFRSREDARKSEKKWFPYNKGGPVRRWYGNAEYVVNWQNDGEELQTALDPTGARIWAHNFNLSYIFRPSVSWGDITTKGLSGRYFDCGYLFDATGLSAFSEEVTSLFVGLALLNSVLGHTFSQILNPTLHFKSGDFARIPLPDQLPATLGGVVQEAISIARADWDNAEFSADFKTLPLLRHEAKRATLSDSWGAWEAQSHAALLRLQALEVENNRLLIAAYGLEGELPADVPLERITLVRAEALGDTFALISYAIGCMMGRYSLDKPGLIYANAGGIGFDPTQYTTFRADDDGILALTEADWGLPDDAAARFEEFISVAWPKGHLEENLTFVAESLDAKKGESSRETIRRYLATGFYKHHLQMYKRRPIYWLFSSGKLRAFQCLVYLHRYNGGTLARMRTEYVIPLQGRIAGRIQQLEDDKAKPSSTAHLKKIQKELDGLKKEQAELRTFDEKLKHYADKRIALDLDDGVKVNYGKFGDLLAEVKAVTGGSDE